MRSRVLLPWLLLQHLGQQPAWSCQGKRQPQMALGQSWGAWKGTEQSHQRQRWASPPPAGQDAISRQHELALHEPAHGCCAGTRDEQYACSCAGAAVPTCADLRLLGAWGTSSWRLLPARAGLLQGAEACCDSAGRQTPSAGATHRQPRQSCGVAGVLAVSHMQRVLSKQPMRVQAALLCWHACAQAAVPSPAWPDEGRHQP